MAARAYVTPQKTIADVLVEQGIIASDVCQKLMVFIRQNTPGASPQQASPTPPEAKAPEPPAPKAEIQIEAGTLDAYLQEARRNNASDLHVTPNNPVAFRRFGKLVSIHDHVLDKHAVENLLRASISGEMIEAFIKKGDLEFVHQIGSDRYRSVMMRERNGWTFTARVIPNEIPSFAASNLPPSCLNLIKWTQGMILITGPVGSGKSTTMATLVNMLNQERSDHIITIEDPIEVVYPPGKCQMTQREIKKHTESQATALRGALRQDPDVLVISELRDLESMQLAVSAAETGHLVLATMNTTSASRTIYRLVDSFPPDERQIIRNMVSESLRGVISQQLIPRMDGTGMVPAYEVLLVNKAISNLIRKDNAHMIGSAMMTGRAGGMVLLDDSLQTLVDQKLIDGREAFYRAINVKNFAKYVAGDGQMHLELISD